MTEYKYAAGRKSIICYDNHNRIVEKFEESIVSLTKLEYEKEYLKIGGELEVEHYPEELELYIKLNDKKYYPALKKEGKIQFTLEERAALDKRDKLSIWVSYNHIKVKVNIDISGMLANKRFYKIDKYRLRVKKKEIVVSDVADDVKWTVKSLGRRILHR